MKKTKRIIRSNKYKGTPFSLMRRMACGEDCTLGKGVFQIVYDDNFDEYWLCRARYESAWRGTGDLLVVGYGQKSNGMARYVMCNSYPDQKVYVKRDIIKKRIIRPIMAR